LGAAFDSGDNFAGIDCPCEWLWLFIMLDAGVMLQQAAQLNGLQPWIAAALVV
jgi:hypothetical protein